MILFERPKHHRLPPTDVFSQLSSFSPFHPFHLQHFWLLLDFLFHFLDPVPPSPRPTHHRLPTFPLSTTCTTTLTTSRASPFHFRKATPSGKKTFWNRVSHDTLSSPPRPGWGRVCVRQQHEHRRFCSHTRRKRFGYMCGDLPVKLLFARFPGNKRRFKNKDQSKRTFPKQQ